MRSNPVRRRHDLEQRRSTGGALSGPARARLPGLLSEDAAEAKQAMAERRARGALVLPGLPGTPFAGWSKVKAALDKAVAEGRGKAATAAGTSPTPIGPWSHDLRRTVATSLQRLGALCGNEPRALPRSCQTEVTYAPIGAMK
jgi:hypothetical protein